MMQQLQQLQGEELQEENAMLDTYTIAPAAYTDLDGCVSYSILVPKCLNQLTDAYMHITQISLEYIPT